MAIKKFNSVEGFSVGEVGNVFDVIDNIGNVTAGNLIVNTLADLGNVSNVRITGGSYGYTLRTDGAGNLSWGIDSAAAAGDNTQVQFNDSNIFAGSANFTFNKTSNTLSVTNIIANGAQLTSLTGANVTGQVGNALIAGTVYTNSQPNITSVGTLASLAVTANITSGNAIIGGGSGGSITGANLVSANYFIGNASLLTAITGANVTGTVANANYSTYAGTVTTNAQPNITSVGTLSSLSVTANITSGNANLGNLVVANFFSGDGGYLSNLQIASYTVANANYANFAGTVLTNAQPNITSVGTLASLSVSGTLSTGDATINGNLTVTGNYQYSNVTILNVKDPVIEQGGNTNGSPLTANDGADRGQLLHYYTTAPVDAFMGWKNAEGEFVFASNASLAANNVATVNQYGNIRVGNIVGSNLVTANYFTGNGYLLAGITGANVNGTVANANYSLYAGTVTTNAQPNITSVGTLSSLTVTANITSGNANLGNLVVANFFSGDGGYLSNLQISGATVANANYANFTGTVITNAQPNITSVGTLSNLTITGNITSGNADLGNLVIANFFTGNGALLSSLTGANVTGTVANSNYSLYAGTVLTNAQPNITSVGTLSSLTVTANITSGNATLGNLTTSNYFTGNGSLLTSLTGGNVTGQVANALIAGTVYTNAQPNITSVGTLAGLTSTGTANFVGASNVSLGTISNVHITGGTSGYILQTDGSGTLTWVSPSSTGIAGLDTQVQFNDGGAFGANANFTFNKTTSTLNVIGTITRDSKSVPTFVSSATAPTNPKLGDEWYDTDNDIIYQYIYDGANYNWIDVSSGYITANSSAVPNTIALRDANANIAANYFIGNGSQLTGIGSAGSVSNGTSNISIPIVNGNVNTSVNGNANILVVTGTGANVSGTFNITGNLTSGNANLGNLTVSNYFSGNGSLLTSLTGSNVSGNVTSAVQSHYANIANSVAGANVSGNVTSAVQSHYANIANSVSGSNVSGNVTSAVQSHYANIANSVAGGNVSGQVSNALVAGTIYTNAQPNITSVGTLSSLTITANITSGNANLGNLVVANFFSGDGGYLSNLQISTATVANANYANFAGTVLTNAQPNITSVGSLSSLVVSGDTTLTGNLIVSGTVEYTNVTTLKIQDPIIEQGGNANGAPLINNDGKDRGQLLHYYTTAPVDAFMGYKNSSGEFVFASNASISSDVITVNTYGNIHVGNANLGNLVTANYYTGNGYLLTSLNGSNILGNVTSAVQSHYANIANSVSGSNVSGNVTSAVQSHYANIANSVAGGNVSGQVGNALVAGTVYTNAQPNITSVGTLASLSVTANISSGNANLGNLVVANFFSGDGGYLSNLQISGATVANANYATFAGTVLTNAQPNITSVGTLSSLTVTANISSGNANLGNLATASYFTGNGSLITYIAGANVFGNVTSAVQSHYANIANSVSGTNVSGNVASAVQAHYANIANSVSGSNVSGQVSNALVAGTVYTNAQPNITSVGTLSSLSVTANITSGNVIIGGGSGGSITGANLVSANYISGNGSLLTSLTGSNVSGNVTSAVQSHYANIANSVAGGNVSGQVGNSLVAGTVYTNAQPNITSIGSLSGLIVSNSSGVVDFTTTANVTLGNVSNLHISGGSAGYTLRTDGTGNLSWAVDSAAAGGNTTEVQFNDTGSLTGNSNFTFNKTTSVLTVTGNIVSNNANLGNLVIANYFSGSGNLLSNIQGSNVSGNVTSAVQSHYANIANSVAGANVSGNVTSAVQSHYANIANSVAGANVSGNVTSAVQSHYANIANSVAGGNVSGQVGNALVAGTVYTNAQPNITSVGSLSGLTVSNSSGIVDFTTTANVTLGNVSTLHISGGSAGYTLRTDGTGNLSWAVDSAAAGGNTTEVQFNDTGSLTGNSNFTFNKSTSLLTVNGNVVSNNANLGNLVIGNFFSGSGNLLSNIQGSNVSGNVTSAVQAHYANIANSVAGGNVSGQVSNALVAGTVYTNAQPNITSVGTLSSLTVTANITSGNANLGNLVTANFFTGNGYYLTGLPAGYSNTDVAAYLPTYTGNVAAGNLLTNNLLYSNGSPYIFTTNAAGSNTYVQFNDNNAFEGSANFIFNKTSNTLSVTNIIANGSGLTSLAGANVTGQVANALVSGTVYTNAQPNITSVGTLSGLTVNGTSDLGDVSNITITGGTAGYVLTTNGAGAVSWQATTGGSGTSGFVNIVKNRFTGNAVANTFSLTTTPASVNLIEVNIDGLLQISNTYSLAGSVVSFSTPPATGQIIEVTTYGSANITGGDGAIQFSTSSNLLASSANLNFDSVTNTLTANYFSGNGSALTGIAGANVSGTVANANYSTYAGTVITNAQPNITSTGTLASLSVTGNISGNNITSNSNLTVSGGYLTIDTGLIAVSSGNAGMFTSGISNINIGLAGNVTLGSTSGNVSARGTLSGANITTSGNLSVSDTASITNLKVNDFYSNRTPVTVTTNTVVDSFPINKYRSAKYTMRINSDDGYQAVEALLIHNGIQSFVTIYGSLSTISTEIVTLSTDINSGSVRMLATTVSANTTVNMLGTYVAD